MCFSQQMHHKVNFPVGHYLSALRMVNKHYVQKHVSYYCHAHYFYILNDIFVTSLRIRVTFYKPLFSFISQFACMFFLCLFARGSRGEERPPRN